MGNPSVAIFGASGLVGSALCERLYFQHGPCFRAFIHTFANAARIARFPIEIQRIDLLKVDQVRSAIAGCDCVVNCVLGDHAAMVRGLKNIIRAAREIGAKKFIHLGSIAIYGEDPAPECESEDAEPTPTNEYGRMKQRQDDLVFELHRSGVPSIVLCSGHVTGPYSPFTSGALERLLAKDIVLVDAGRHPTNHIHVDNLVEAILAAIRANQGWGERYFVTESERPTWAQLYADLRDILGLQFEFAQVAREEVVRLLVQTPPRRHFSDNLKALASSEFRNSLTVIPAFAAINGFAREVFHSLNPELQGRLRATWNRPRTFSSESSAPDLAQRFITVQVRRPYFAPRKIQQRLGYAPILTYKEGMETIRRWYNFPSSS
jgi:nucleoside-diphosphate-sugar epimerase